MVEQLKQQPQISYRNGGIRILVDAYNGWIPNNNEDVTTMDVLSLTALIFLCCMTMSCLFTTSNMTATANANGGVVVIDGNNRNRNGREEDDLLPGRYRHGLRLLNREEVLSLPEIEYKSEKLCRDSY